MGAPTRPAVLALVALAAALTLAPGAHARTLKAAAAVPGGATCPLTKLAVDAYYTTDDKGARVTRGTITLYNTGSAPLFIKEVSVQLLPGNEQNARPLTVTAGCPFDGVPAAAASGDKPGPGLLVCEFQAPARDGAGAPWRGAWARAGFRDADKEGETAACDTPVMPLAAPTDDGTAVAVVTVIEQPQFIIVPFYVGPYPMPPSPWPYCGPGSWIGCDPCALLTRPLWCVLPVPRPWPRPPAPRPLPVNNNVGGDPCTWGPGNAPAYCSNPFWNGHRANDKPVGGNPDTWGPKPTPAPAPSPNNKPVGGNPDTWGPKPTPAPTPAPTPNGKPVGGDPSTWGPPTPAPKPTPTPMPAPTPSVQPIVGGNPNTWSPTGGSGGGLIGGGGTVRPTGYTPGSWAPTPTPTPSSGGLIGGSGGLFGGGGGSQRSTGSNPSTWSPSSGGSGGLIGGSGGLFGGGGGGGSQRSTGFNPSSWSPSGSSSSLGSLSGGGGGLTGRLSSWRS